MALLKMKREGKTVAVRLDREAVIVGSGPACNIKVPEGGLAQRHAQILRMNNGFILRDLSGDAGTFVNGKKVKEHLLSDRDVIQMGQERFTYAEQEGENTARVAVSAAPPATARAVVAGPPPTQRTPAAAPAKPAPTARVAVDPNRKTTTRAMPPAPAAEPAPAGKNTARMTKGNTQKLATASTRRMSSTGRTTGRIAKSTGTFSMPKTRKGKVLAASVALGLLGLGGVMTMVLLNQDDPKAIREDLVARIVLLNKMNDTPIKMEQEAEDILGNIKFKKYGAEDYRKLEKAKPVIHKNAVEQKAADAEVTPFLQKVKTAQADPEKMKTDADTLYDEAKSLADKYASSNYADKLKTIRDELKKGLEDRKSAGDYKILLVTLKAKVETKITKEGQCKEATGMVDEFGVKFNEKENAELFGQLKEVRDRIKRGSEDWVKKKNTEAQNLVKDGKKADAVKLLEGCRAGLEGFTTALEKLEANIKALK